MIKTLTSLRGIFILFIFFHHCLFLYPGGGTMAVSFFFILSGFSLTLGYKDKLLNGNFNYRQYIIRRSIKFYPLHWLCLLVAVPLALRSFEWVQVPYFFINATLLHTLLPIKELYFSFNAVSWYLADTMFFAVVFPFLLRGIVNLGVKIRVLLAIVVAVIYTVVAIYTPTEYQHSMLYISPFVRTTDFIFGIFLALLFLELKKNRKVKDFTREKGKYLEFTVLALIVLLVVESCVAPKQLKMVAPIYWIPEAILIIVASLYDENWGGQKLLCNKYLIRLGEISFTIFLTHQLVLSYSSILFDSILHLNKNVVYVVFTLVVTITVSLFIDEIILKPITQWLTKKIQPSMIAQS